MSELRLPADSGGGSISIKGPSSSSSDVDLLDTSGNLKLSDGDELRLGTDNDLKIYHTGSAGYISNNTGQLDIEAKTGEVGVRIYGDGSTQLAYDGSVKVYTYSNGFKGNDNIRFALGDNDDFYMTHDGTTILENQTTGGAFYILNRADARLQFGTNNAWQQFTDSTGNWLPYTNDSRDIGQSNLKWDDIWATNDTIETSDRDKKENIAVSDLGLSFVNKLKPVSFKRKGKTRTHYGLIAQDIETLLSDISKSTTDFAGFIKTESEAILYEDGEEEGKKAGEVRIPASTDYGLRYGEFIAPLIKAVQELSTEVETLKAKVAALEAA